MNTLIILGTSRDDSNTLVELKRKYSPNSYDLVVLHQLNIKSYSYTDDHLDDDFISVADKMVLYDHIIFATPVYWYAMSGQMKNFFDRLTNLLGSSKVKGRALKGKTTELFSTGSGTDLPEGFEVPFKLTSEYFDMKFKGSSYISVN